MKKYDRDLVLQVVKARMERQQRETCAFDQRVQELLGTEGAQQEDPRQKVILEALLPEMTEIVTDMVLSEEPLEVLIDDAIDKIIDAITEALLVEGEESDEEIGLLRTSIKIVSKALIEEFSSGDGSSVGNLHLEEIIVLAEKYGVTLGEVIARDELYRELVRLTTTEEEFRRIFDKLLNICENPEEFLSSIIGPMVELMVAQEEAMYGEEISAEEVAKMKEDMQMEMASNDDFRQQIGAMRMAVEMVIEERVAEYFG